MFVQDRFIPVLNADEPHHNSVVGVIVIGLGYQMSSLDHHYRSGSHQLAFICGPLLESLGKVGLR